MARFRSGTLERSVKRWGKMPRFGGKLQRVNHSWKYVITEETALGNTGAAPVDLVLCDNTDWAGSGGGTGVKNMSFDLHIGVVWTPNVSTALSTFNSIGLKLGIFCLDGDDTAPGNMDNLFGDTRAVAWRVKYLNLQQMNTSLVAYYPRDVNWRIKGRQRFMKFEEELRLVVEWDQDVSSVIADSRLSVFGRMSWETP